MHATFTSGAARRAAVSRAQVRTPLPWRTDGKAVVPGIIDRLNHHRAMIVNVRDDERGLTNPILDGFRDFTYQGDPDMGYQAHEWLFQLARHWVEWQSPRIGTFPLDYRDPSGPVSKEDSYETSEDAAYWYIEAVLDEADGGSNRVQDLIVHATAVLTRLLNAHPID